MPVVPETRRSRRSRGVGQVAQKNEIAKPDKAHPFIDLDPGGHIQPATARDTLPGSGEVRADGSYHYALPIEVPQGRGEVTPRLSIEYSSRACNGTIGV